MLIFSEIVTFSESGMLDFSMLHDMKKITNNANMTILKFFNTRMCSSF